MIDLSYYIKLSNNNPDFLKKIITIFIENTPLDIKNLENSINEKNLLQIRENSHKLKSLFKSYNLTNLTNYMLELEKIGKSDSFSEEAFSLLEKVKLEFEIYLKEMNELFKNFNSSSIDKYPL